MSRSTENVINEFDFVGATWKLTDSAKQTHRDGIQYCEYSICQASIPISGIKTSINWELLEIKRGDNFHLYIPTDIAPRNNVDFHLDSKISLFAGNNLYLYDKNFEGENDIQWEYLAHGNFSVIYHTTLKKELVVGDVTYPVGYKSIYRLMLPKFIDMNDQDDVKNTQAEIRANSPERTMRLFNEARERMRQRELYLPASVYQVGVIVPFLDGHNIIKSDELRLAILGSFTVQCDKDLSSAV